MAKLTLTRCVIKGDRTKSLSATKDKFLAVINPASYKHGYGIEYTEEDASSRKPIGKSATSPRFSNVSSETISFSLILDGTGVVEDRKKQSVDDQFNKLKSIVYGYVGNEHEPSVVKLSWGRGVKAFYCRLKEMSVDYTLFHPDGHALRANVSLSFVSYKTQKEEAVEADRKSPDMTHKIEVRDGDRLPELCNAVYADPGLYIAVAKENDLDGFRAIPPGEVLNFPPSR